MSKLNDTTKNKLRINIYLPPDLSEKIYRFRKNGLSINVSQICALALSEWIEENGWRLENPVDIDEILKVVE